MKAVSPLAVERALGFDSPAELYRVTYKYTDCGPSVGVRLTKPSAAMRRPPPWDKDTIYYCDRLRGLGTWAEMSQRRERVVSLLVSSIVEGVDWDTEAYEIECFPLRTLQERWEAAVDAVNKEADEIWKQTHGCDDCGDEDDLGNRPINPDCPSCHGEGVIL